MKHSLMKTSLTEKMWQCRPNAGVDRSEAVAFARQLNVAPTVAELLVQRGVKSDAHARQVLHPQLTDLHEPLLMRGMSLAVDRILRAIETQEKILIYGDYDVDGTTGTVVMRRALELLGARTGYHIPHRFTEGYGINTAALERAKAEGYSLVISVDCGIRAFEPLTWGRDNNLDCIVTDHHLPDELAGAPPALAVLNPNQSNCDYPDKHLAGVGVAYKLAAALLRARGREHLSKAFLKLVAIGTVADIAPLVGENRAIVKLGLADLPNATNFGLQALMRVAGCYTNDGFAVDAYDIGFRLGPRINAAGRMDAARQVVELFEAREQAIAEALAQRLDELNRERQAVQKEIFNCAVADLESHANTATHVAVIAGEGWHRGVIGLAASKIAERYHRPSVVISLDGTRGHGSGRSIEGYHLLSGLESCAELFEQFGGHAAAAGLAIKSENVNELRAKLNAHAVQYFGANAPVPRLQFDKTLASNDVNLDLIESLKRLEPFGAGWHKPVFHTADLRTAGAPRIMKERHLKLYAVNCNGHRFELVWWGGAETLQARGYEINELLPHNTKFEVLYTPKANEWQGKRAVQLVIEDLRIER